MTAVWETILEIAKWAFLGLIYLVLLGVVFAVRREMGQRMVATTPSSLARSGRLKVVRAGSSAGLQPGQVLVLQDQTRIGAHRDNDIVLDDRYVSAHHACLRWDGSAWLLQDMGSANGTTVDGRRYPAHREEPIPIGASIEIGDVILELLE